jgi:hypothetical protein|tara:strand:- start:19867 stop:20340 length:474 start_codon:yes stop_codon:yes gene_type:complete
MSLYTEIFKIHPYLKSIRTLEEKYFSIDIKFSKTWRLPKEYVNESKVLEHQSDEPNKRYISFVSKLEESDLNETINNIEKIIDYNIEREEKENLFKVKIKDLKEVFEKERLEDLRNLEFDIPSYEEELPEEEYTLNSIEDNEQRETDRLVSEGANKG